MAPKKKKRAAANPARGFTTVSVPSKPKQDDLVADSPTATNDGVNIEPASSVMDTPTTDPGAPPNIQNMLPDELEDYLERAEIEGLLESDGTRCKSDAVRQITKLKTEIRQLRAQSTALTTFGWLDDSLISGIIALQQEEHTSLFETVEVPSGDHKLLLDLWVLDQVLSALSLPRVDDVLDQIIHQALSRSFKSSSGYIWGLSQALDWYALNLSLQELPKYHLASDLPIQDAEDVASSPLLTQAGESDCSYTLLND